MKKILGIIVVGLLLSTSAFSKSLQGQGSIKFNEGTLNHFTKYLSTGIQNKDLGASRAGKGITFAVSVSGRMSGYIYCPHGKYCTPNDSIGAIKQCRKWVKKYLKIKEKCYVFAHGRKIVWNNEMFRIPSKASREDVLKILNDLNFYDLSSTTITPKSTKSSATYINTNTGKLFKVEKKVAMTTANTDGYKKPLSPAKSTPMLIFKKAKNKCLKSKNGSENNCEIYSSMNPEGVIKKYEISKKESKKITKKKSQSTDIVSKLKDLKDLLDSGVLTNEEFEKAKKKLLN